MLSNKSYNIQDRKLLTASIFIEKDKACLQCSRRPGLNAWHLMDGRMKMRVSIRQIMPVHWRNIILTLAIALPAFGSFYRQSRQNVVEIKRRGQRAIGKRTNAAERVRPQCPDARPTWKHAPAAETRERSRYCLPRPLLGASRMLVSSRHCGRQNRRRVRRYVRASRRSASRWLPLYDRRR
jgi:hypothetical protein